MHLPDTINSLGCVEVCFPTYELDEAAFYATLIDLLLTATGIELADITTADLEDAVETARCNLQERTAFQPSSPLALKAIALYLAQNLE
jgi:hypothetical protein